MPLMDSRMIQNHMKPADAFQPRRTGTSKHHRPNNTREMLRTRNPTSRSEAINPVKKAAGGNVSQSRPRYSSTE